MNSRNAVTYYGWRPNGRKHEELLVTIEAGRPRRDEVTGVVYGSMSEAADAVGAKNAELKGEHCPGCGRCPEQGCPDWCDEPREGRNAAEW